MALNEKKMLASYEKDVKINKTLLSIIESKDAEIKSQKEKAENLQKALDVAEAHLVSQARLAAARQDPDTQLSSASQSVNTFPTKTGVSTDLVTKLMQQNGRLRMVLKGVLGLSGKTVEDYLGECEKKDIVEQLRDDLRISNKSNEHLKNRCAKQDEIIQKYQKKCVMLESVLSAYEIEYEALKERFKHSEAINDVVSQPAPAAQPDEILN